MKIKLYSWTALRETHNPDVGVHIAYGISKEDYQELAKRPLRVIKDTNISYFVHYRGRQGFFIPHSFVKEIIHED